MGNCFDRESSDGPQRPSSAAPRGSGYAPSSSSAAATPPPRQTAKRGAAAPGPPSEQKQVALWIQTGIVGLRDRGLKALPPGVAAVGPDAKVLDASSNKLTVLPTLATLCNLQRLVLASNVIGSVPGPALAALASCLKILTLDGNRISALPNEISLLSLLEKLSIKDNSLSDLNPGVGQLKALQLLVLSGNRLAALPESLEGCEQLEELDASSNVIAAIPASLGALQRLKTVKLDGNRVTQVPPAIYLNCGALQTLSLHSNPITPDTVQETEGFQVFEQRRRDKYSKVIAGGAAMGSRGMDEGYDRNTKRL